MTAEIDLQVDTRDLERLIKQLEGLNARGIDFAMGKGLTDAGFAVRRSWQAKAVQVFDRPTPFTVNSIFVEKYRRGSRTARVKFRDEMGDGTAPAKYLQNQAFGGTRNDKRFENALQSRGLLPQGMQTFPAKGFPLDAFGNLSRGVIQKIMAQLRIFRDKLQNETDRSRERAARKAAREGRQASRYFVLTERRGRLPPGIYERTGFSFGGKNVSAIRLVVAYGRTAKYVARFNHIQYAKDVFNTVGVTYIDIALTAEIERALAKAARKT